MTAYRAAGIQLPRTTYGMLSSWKLIPEARWQARWGDLAFFGSGHVELVGPDGGTIGAHDSGSRVSWIGYSPWWHPDRYFRVAGAS
jgi:cell wall-associated NlpC family hydrolase